MHVLRSTELRYIEITTPEVRWISLELINNDRLQVEPAVILLLSSSFLPSLVHFPGGDKERKRQTDPEVWF